MRRAFAAFTWEWMSITGGRPGWRPGDPADHLATEEEAAGLFADCEAGAIPALGTAYGIETMLDESLDDEPVLYFEAGDHEHLVRLDSGAFFRLLGDCRRGQFSSAG